MKIIKKIISMMMVVIIMAAAGGINAKAAAVNEGYVEIAIEDAAAYASNYYSRGLVTLNIATAGVSNECTISAGSVPSGAKISKVELRGTKSTGSGAVYWYVEHNASGGTASSKFASPATITSFNGLTADSSWTIWIQGDAWSTVKGGTIKIYYTY